MSMGVLGDHPAKIAPCCSGGHSSVTVTYFKLKFLRLKAKPQINVMFGLI